MLSVTFLFLVGALMLLASMICMSLICKPWSGQGLLNKVRYQVQELAMLVQLLERIGLLSGEATIEVESLKWLS
nr:hypothetical protein Iba_chr06cCG11400 [Ipomoea batatas]GMD10783.1 hypothetical protein Iba_chr06eCG9540 [Ipomoea batatas]